MSTAASELNMPASTLYKWVYYNNDHIAAISDSEQSDHQDDTHDQSYIEIPDDIEDCPNDFEEPDDIPDDDIPDDIPDDEDPPDIYDDFEELPCDDIEDCFDDFEEPDDIPDDDIPDIDNLDSDGDDDFEDISRNIDMSQTVPFEEQVAEQPATYLSPLFDMSSVLSEQESEFDFFDQITVSPCIKHYIFVDYENVKSSGLVGFDDLGEDCCIRIYYSDACPNIPISLAKHMMTAKFRIEFTKVFLPIKNAADCQILFEMRYAFAHNKSCNFYVISQDSDFDKPLLIYLARGMKVCRAGSVAKAMSIAKHSDLTESHPVLFKDEKEALMLLTDDKSKTVSQAKKPVSKPKESRHERITKLFSGSGIAIQAHYKPYKNKIIDCVTQASSADDLNRRLCKACKGLTGEYMSKLYKVCKNWL